MFKSTKGPARPIRPGQIIQRELDARGWTQNDLAAVMGRPSQAISEIITAKKQITAETAIELGEAFGVDAAFWSTLQSNYSLHQARQQKAKPDVARRSQLYSATPLAELIKRGWVSVTRKSPLEEQEAAVCGLLCISKIGAEPKLAVSFRSSEHRGPEWSSKVAWAKRVEQLAKPQVKKLPAYSAAALKKKIPALLKLASSAEGVAEVPAFLAKLGIGFLVLPHLPKTYLDGAILPVDGHPVVALSLRYDRIDNFWFTLLHEIAHCLEGHYVFIEQNGEDEDEADRQAADWLVPAADFDKFVKQCGSDFTLSGIEAFANRINRHPGIVVGQLQRRVKDFGYANGRHTLTKIRPLLVRHTHS
jgi:HTH-type transcriptional regulator/antitoxin HigA